MNKISDDILCKVEKPSRYVGGELNQVIKEERKFHDRPYSVKKENNTESKIAKGFQYIYFKDFLDEVGSGKYKIVKSFDEGITSCEFTIQ